MLGKLKGSISPLVNPLADVLFRIGIRPNHVTALALSFGILASFFIAKSDFIFGAVLLAFSGFLDLLDGALARSTGMVTGFGGIADSVADRYVDAAILIAFGIAGFDWLVVSLALLGSLMVSYTRARAENVIERCDVGIAERGERALIVIAGLITGYIYEALLLLIVLSHLTVVQRVVHAWRQLNREPDRELAQLKK